MTKEIAGAESCSHVSVTWQASCVTVSWWTFDNVGTLTLGTLLLEVWRFTVCIENSEHAFKYWHKWSRYVKGKVVRKSITTILGRYSMVFILCLQSLSADIWANNLRNELPSGECRVAPCELYKASPCEPFALEILVPEKLHNAFQHCGIKTGLLLRLLNIFQHITLFEFDLRHCVWFFIDIHWVNEFQQARTSKLHEAVAVGENWTGQ